MKRAVLVLLAAGAIALAQEHAPAAAIPEGSPNKATVREVENAPVNETNDLLWKWVNFAILAGGIGYLAVKYGGPYFRDRRESIEKGISDAAQVKADAEKRAAEIEARISNLSQEIDELRKSSTAEMQKEAERIRAETASEIAKVQQRAEQEITAAAKAATHDLKVYSAQLALDLAEQQIRSRMNAPVQDELVRTFVRDIDNTTEKAAVS